MKTVIGVVCAVVAVLLMAFVACRDVKRHEKRKHELKRKLCEKSLKPTEAQNN